MSSEYEKFNPIGFAINSYLKFFGEIFAFSFLGFIVWLTLFICFTFWKSFVITYFRHIDDHSLGLHDNLLKLKQKFRPMVIFTAFIFVLYLTVAKIELKVNKIIIQRGWVIFMIIYLCYYAYNYVYLKNEFDYFEDWTFFYNMINKRYKKEVKKLKKD